MGRLLFFLESTRPVIFLLSVVVGIRLSILDIG